MSKQTKLTKSARGEECQVRLAGICNHDPATVVLAHLNGGGMGMKHLDMHGAYACSACHDALDRRAQHDLELDFIKLAHYEAMVRTQQIMVRKGLLCNG